MTLSIRISNNCNELSIMRWIVGIDSLTALTYILSVSWLPYNGCTHCFMLLFVSWSELFSFASTIHIASQGFEINDSAIPPVNNQLTVIGWGEAISGKVWDNPASSLMQANLHTLNHFKNVKTFVIFHPTILRLGMTCSVLLAKPRFQVSLTQPWLASGKKAQMGVGFSGFVIYGSFRIYK